MVTIGMYRGEENITLKKEKKKKKKKKEGQLVQLKCTWNMSLCTDYPSAD